MGGGVGARAMGDGCLTDTVTEWHGPQNGTHGITNSTIKMAKTCLARTQAARQDAMPSPVPKRPGM